MRTIVLFAALATAAPAVAAEPQELHRHLKERELVALVGERVVVECRKLMAELRSPACLLDLAYPVSLHVRPRGGSLLVEVKDLLAHPPRNVGMVAGATGGKAVVWDGERFEVRDLVVVEPPPAEEPEAK